MSAWEKNMEERFEKAEKRLTLEILHNNQRADYIHENEVKIESLEQKYRLNETQYHILYEKLEKLEQKLERYGQMLVEDEDRYDKLESVLKGWRLKLLNDKDSKPDSDILYTCKNCGNEIDQIEFEVQKLSISISREDWDYTCGLALLGIDDESESEREELEKLTKIMKEVEKL